MKQTLSITEKDGVVRVDKHLAETYPEYSRAAITKLFELNLIKLDGKPIQPGHRLRPGAEIEYDLGPLQAKPEVIELPIIYEDDGVIVINKPAGIISHARGKFWQEASVASFIREKLATSRTSKVESRRSDQHDRAGIVHRLDRATSGVMICAKNTQALKFLQKQFSERTTEKTYIAITDNKPKQDSATISAPIARNAKDPKCFRVDSAGKSAETAYELIDSAQGKYTIKLRPKTGRTHQLRIHLAYINCPIIGDELYGGTPNARLLLHAEQLTLTMPNGEKKTFTAPLPDDFIIDGEGDSA